MQAELLLLLPPGDRFLDICAPAFPKTFQSPLLVWIQFRLDLGQGGVKSIASLQHRLALNRLHLLYGGFHARADPGSLFGR